MPPLIKNKEWYALRNRTPEEWRENIERIRCHNIRLKVASIVWWDFFGERNTTERWPHLDNYLSQYGRERYTREETVMRALMLVGYPEHQAIKRCITPKDANESRRENVKKLKMSIHQHAHAVS